MNSQTNKLFESATSSCDQSLLFKYIWPIHRHETQQFLFTTLLMFCILFIQNLVRAMKDSIVITAIGAESTSFLKLWGVMPVALLVTIIYVKLIMKFRAQTVFYIIFSSFLVFFALFAFVIFPNHEYYHVHPDVAANWVMMYPHLKWFILSASKWAFSVFYIISELWANVVFALLFWQFVNSTTSVDQSKRFYVLFGLFAQTGIYLAGQLLKNIKFISINIVNYFGFTTPVNIFSVQLILAWVIFLGLVAIFSFWYLNRYIFANATIEFKVKKKKMSLLESFKMVASSRYIRLIAILLISYGVAINLAEAPWKAKAEKLYPTTLEYLTFVGGYLSYTGLFTIIFVLIGSNIVRFLGWYAAAIITPMMVFVTGMGFFGVSNFDIVGVLGIAVSDPIALAIIIGAIQNVLSKSSKYTVFDSTKEMAYVPLDDDLKTKGKAAVDVMGSKIGKSFSAFLQSFIFIIMPSATYHLISVYLMGIFTVTCMIWIWAVRELSKEYGKATNKLQK